MKNIIDHSNEEQYSLMLDSSVTISVEFYPYDESTEFVVPCLYFSETEGEHIYMDQGFGAIHRNNIECFMLLIMAMYDETKTCRVSRWVNVWKNEDDLDTFFFEFGHLTPSK